MILWETKPSNIDIPHRFANMYCAMGYTHTERGVEILLSQFLSAVFSRATSSIDPPDVAEATTWVCIDWWYEGKTRSMKKNLMPKAMLIWTNVYPPRGGKRKMSDVFEFSLVISRPGDCPFYSDDRQTYASRLLQTAHKAWVEAWRTMEEVHGHPTDRWPVKYWIHGRPDVIWQIADDWSLERAHGHPPVDENIAMAQFPTVV